MLALWVWGAHTAIILLQPDCNEHGLQEHFQFFPTLLKQHVRALQIYFGGKLEVPLKVNVTITNFIIMVMHCCALCDIYEV